MNKNYKKYVNKIAFIKNENLPGLKTLPGGHYVIIKNIDFKNKKCDVNIVTSLEDRNRNFNEKRLNKVRRGFLYSIPVDDASFNRWSAINLDTVKGIDLNHIQLNHKIKIKRKHYYFYKKFSK